MTQPDESPPRRGQDSPIPQTSTIPRSASFSPGAPTLGIATFEQLLRGGENWSSRWPWNSSTPASSSSCTSPVIIDRELDPEESHSHSHSHSLRNSPSVLARVKEKWRRVCRRSSLDLNNTPPWGVSLDDIDDPFYEDETNQSISHPTEY